MCLTHSTSRDKPESTARGIRYPRCGRPPRAPTARGILRLMLFVWIQLSVGSVWNMAQDRELVVVPDKYVLTYPLAQQCCPPIRSTFAEVTQSYGIVRGHRFNHQQNGGYGLPIIDKVDGQNLLHTGADLGWYQVGEPVFAIADGVVRQSHGPQPSDAKTAPQDPNSMQWGNIIVLEHRFGEKEFYTSIYGHLGVDRKVRVGDIVVAGQMIGEIGRKHSYINGGYNPHVHVGIRTGRKAEIGSPVFRLMRDGKRFDVTITELGEDFVTVSVPAGLRLPMQVSIGKEAFELREQEGKTVLPARALWFHHREDFPIVGYSLSKKGWEDPVAFLRRQQADTNPAPLRSTK